ANVTCRSRSVSPPDELVQRAASVFLKNLPYPLPPMDGTIDAGDDKRHSDPRRAPEEEGRPAALSAGELRIWAAHETELTGGHHRVFVARIRGRVEGERLELALERLIQRHPALRTVYRATHVAPVRRVRSNTDFQLNFVDALRWGAAELEEIVALTSLQPMDLSASVFRAVLFNRGDREHTLLLVAHRIAVGQHAFRVMLRDLWALYAGDPLPPLKARRPPPA